MSKYDLLHRRRHNKEGTIFRAGLIVGLIALGSCNMAAICGMLPRLQIDSETTSPLPSPKSPLSPLLFAPATATALAEQIESVQATLTAEARPTNTHTPEPTNTATSTVTQIATQLPTDTPKPTNTPFPPTDTPQPTDTQRPTDTPVSTFTVTPEPTVTPTADNCTSLAPAAQVAAGCELDTQPTDVPPAGIAPTSR